MKPTEPTEHAEQCAVMTWAALNAAKWPCLRLLHAIPNGAFFGGEVKQLKGGKHVPVAAIRARKLKAEGLKEGVPDLCLPVPGRADGPPSAGAALDGASALPSHGLYIELKRRTLGRPSAMQQWWHQCLTLQGYRVALCRGADEAIDVLRQHVQHAPQITLPPLPDPATHKGALALLPASKKRRKVSALPSKKTRPFLIPPPHA